MNQHSESENSTPTCRLCSWLIRHAARTGPPPLAERLEEEWLADFAERSSTISRLRFALGCLWATRVIARDHAIAAMPVGASALAGGSIESESRSDSGLFSRRSTTFLLVAVLHLAVFYAFVTGLSSSLTKTYTPPLQNQVVNETHPRDVLTLPPPNLSPVHWDMPKLDDTVTIASDDTRETVRPDVARGPVTTPDPPPPVTPQHMAQLSQGGPGAGFPSPDEYYPLLSRHMEEQGAATVQVCVNASGRLTKEPTVVATSGSARLDEGALKLARAGSGHYRATTEDGRPVDSCYPFRVRFQIRN